MPLVYRASVGSRYRSLRRFPSRAGRKASVRFAARRGSSQRGAGTFGSRQTTVTVNRGIKNFTSPSTWSGTGGQRVAKLSPDYGITYAPNRMIINLKGIQSFTLAGGVGGTMSSPCGFIYLNDIAHPWGSTGRNMVDHDPLGVVQWQAIYRRYKVFACTVDMEMMNSSVLTNMAAWLPQPSDDTYTMAGLNPFDPAEKPGAGSCTLNQCVGNTANNAVGNNQRYAQTYYIRDVEGLTKAQFDADENTYAAYFGISPTQRTKFQFGVGDWYGNNSSACSFLFRVTYHLEVYDRIDPARS